MHIESLRIKFDLARLNALEEAILSEVFQPKSNISLTKTVSNTFQLGVTEQLQPCRCDTEYKDRKLTVVFGDFFPPLSTCREQNFTELKALFTLNSQAEADCRKILAIARRIDPGALAALTFATSEDYSADWAHRLDQSWQPIQEVEEWAQALTSQRIASAAY